MKPQMLTANSENMKERIKTFLVEAEKRRSPSKKRTRTKARVIFSEYCKKLRLKAKAPYEVNDLFPVRPDIIIKEILTINYIEQESIPAHAFEELRTSKSLTEIAGLIDRKNLRIVIATKFEPEWRRFTAAHEIGHWLLHKDVVYLRERPARSIFVPVNEGGQNRLSPDRIRFRERPMTGHELGYSKRPPVEREADTFAAELLMPPDHVVEGFFGRFGGPIYGTRVSEDMAFWLSIGRKRAFTAREFSAWPLRARSSHVAQMSSFNGEHFTSLVKNFGVSTTPMAIQLEDLGLVT